MSPLAWFDIRIVIACQLAIWTVFAVIFFAMKCVYPRLMGVGFLSLGFLLGASGTLLGLFRGSISDLASIVIANTLILTGYLCFYFGIKRFFAADTRGRSIGIWTAGTTVILAVLTLAWFTLLRPHPVLRNLTISFACGILSALIAAALLRHARRRTTLKVFALLMFLNAGAATYHIVNTFAPGTAQTFVESGPAHILSTIGGLIFVISLGIFFQLMIAQELTDAVEHRATHDLLTGTLNRQGIEACLTTELDRAARNRRPLSVVLLDIDRFKTINDSAGHAAGDEALQIVAQGISSSLRSYDLLGRYGGDEFLLLLPETAAWQALEVGDRIRIRLSELVEACEPSRRPTLSIGIAETLLGDNTSTLLARADAALYDAKLAGRNCIRRRESSGVHPIATAS